MCVLMACMAVVVSPSTLASLQWERGRRGLAAMKFTTLTRISRWTNSEYRGHRRKLNDVGQISTKSTKTVDDIDEVKATASTRSETTKGTYDVCSQPTILCVRMSRASVGNLGLAKNSVRSFQHVTKACFAQRNGSTRG